MEIKFDTIGIADVLSRFRLKVPLNQRTGEKVVFYLPEGEHIIGAAPDGACAGGHSEASITVKATKPAVLRIRYGDNGDYHIQPTAL